jgi:acyl carrier protein
MQITNATSGASIAPLTWPPGFQPTAMRSWRWLFRGSNEYRNVVEDISRKLLARQQPLPTCWGDDPLRAEIGILVCKRVRDLYHWPTDRFVPDDSIDVALLMPWDDLDIVELVMQLEEDFDIEVPDAEASTWKTLGDVVDTLAAKRRARISSDSMS